MDKISDLRSKSDDQLAETLIELKREAFNLRFQSATGQLEKPSRVRAVRRSIARIQTLQGERANSAKPAAAPKQAGPARKALPVKAAPKPSRSKKSARK